MRLQILHSGHRPFQKFQMFFIGKMMGTVPGPISALSYRRDFFGKDYAIWIHEVLRSAEHWTLGELEVMGAFISYKNACKYCLRDHIAVAENAMAPEIIVQVMKDYTRAEISPQLKATLGYLEKLTLNPQSLTQSDLQPLWDAGISKAAAQEASQVCAVFSTMNRLADAFDFELAPKPEKVGKFLFKNGYSMASLKG